MPVIANIWNRIIEWFQDRQSRTQLVRGFNASAKDAYVKGIVPVILEASIVKGEPKYRHQFSKLFEGSGFRIKAYSGRQLSRPEVVNIGETILSNDMLVRKMVVLGWDTLQVHCDVGNHGCQWQLHDYIMISANTSVK
jgi:hypothetical protein